MKRKLKLKKMISTSIYLSAMLLVFISMLFIGNVLNNKYKEGLNLSYILRDFIDEEISVTNINSDNIIKPYDKDNISIDIGFYDKDSDEESQQKSLILYENTYMPNTGILYTSNESFDILATLDGTVSKITTDELLGNVVEITHSSNLITTYYSIDNLKVNEGQTIKQGDIIGTSGKNNISSTSDNMLLFEVSLNGTNINPENYYNMKLEDLKN